MIADKIKLIAENMDILQGGSDPSVNAGPTGLLNPEKSDGILNVSHMSSQLRGMQAALLKIMGPMSKIIFKEAVETWSGMGEPSISTLPDLVEILLNEINDSEKEAKYLKMITPYLEDN